MKARALSLKNCAWTLEECRLHGDSHNDTLCLPNIFKSRKVKPLPQAQPSPTSQVDRAARELFVEVLDREAVQELLRSSAGVKAGARRQSHKDPSLSAQEYSEALTCFSLVLQGGLKVGERSSTFVSEIILKLDRQQGVLKRNSIQSDLLSLSRLQDEDKLQTLSAFCEHLSRRYRTLHRPGLNLAVKKYKLSYQDGPCCLSLALLCDLSSGFICNLCLYCPEKLQKASPKPVMEQLLRRLLGPFCSQSPVVHVESPALVESPLQSLLSDLAISLIPASLRDTAQELDSKSVGHLQGWTGPALCASPHLQGPAEDIFLPGFWAALHTICINTFVLHASQSPASGRTRNLTEFSSFLASQLIADSCIPVPALPKLHSCTHPDASSANASKQRLASDGRSSAAGIQSGWSTPGVCGLDNSGNSCYLNAVLQCLCSTIPLVDQLLNRDTRKLLAKAKCRVAEVFVRLLEKMWLGGGSSWSPVEARAMLGSILPQFNNYTQQDAQELLLYLLSTLHDDLKKVVKHQMKYPKQEEIRQFAAESTIISKLFEGQLSYTTVCMHCDHQTHNTQSFTVLSLPLPKRAQKCSTQDCLSLFFEDSVLTGGEQVFCSECGLKRDTMVFTCLDEVPEILVLHLKRFGCRGKNQVKLRANVSFSTKLDLSSFLSRWTPNASSYHLYALVNHTGHLNMGHYTALCFNPLVQSWFCFDDAVVREVQGSFVHSPNAYMLLYSQKPFQRPKVLRALHSDK